MCIALSNFIDFISVIPQIPNLRQRQRKEVVDQGITLTLRPALLLLPGPWTCETRGRAPRALGVGERKVRRRHVSPRDLTYLILLTDSQS
jgi:hypothetical protein